MNTPINRKTLTQHLTYSWWKYVLLILLAFGLTDLVYAVTAYRSPADKRVEFYVYGYADTDTLDAYMETVRAETMPDMEVMRSQLLLNDSNYGAMQLTTYVAAGEGDLYLLPREQFISLASGGAFLALEEDAELMDIFNQAGISLQSGWRKLADTTETHLYGIPASKLPGLTRYAYAENGFLCVLVTGGNDENVLHFLRILCRDMLTDPAAGTEPGAEADTAEPAPAEPGK